MSALERLLDEARQAEPDPLGELDVRRAAQRAALTGRARHRGWTRRRVMLSAGVAAAIAAAVVTLAFTPPVPAPEAPDAQSAPPVGSPEVSEPTDLALETGDRLLAAAGARFQVELAEETARAVRLESGAMLFDVRPIDGGRFSVATPNADVLVLGTVFTVHTTGHGTTVRVYEGRVEVHGDGRVEVVTAGHLCHIGDGTAAPDALEAHAVEAARIRLAFVDDVVGVDADEPSPVAPVSPTTAAAAAASPPETGRARPSFTEARRWIASGDAERALLEAQRATARGEVDPWRMLEGDALRALGRHEEAADTYRRAREELSPPRRQQAGFVEARLRMTALDDPTGAIGALREAGVTAAGSPLRERGLSLEAQLLAQLGRHVELDVLATAYLRDYPEGPRADAMRAHLARPRGPASLGEPESPH